MGLCGGDTVREFKMEKTRVKGLQEREKPAFGKRRTEREKGTLLWGSPGVRAQNKTEKTNMPMSKVIFSKNNTSCLCQSINQNACHPHFREYVSL